MECTGNCVQIEEFNETTYEMRENAATLRARIAALEAQLAQYRWRRVEDEMPQDRGKVLVRFPRREEIWTRIAFYHGDGVWWSGGYTVTPIHWMPIPPAPNEEE